MKLTEDVLPLLQQTWAEFNEDDAPQQGAALSYYAMFSIFPLLLLLVSILGLVLQFSGAAVNARDEILNTVATTFSPSLRDTLDQVLSTVENNAAPAGIVGLVTLLIGASGVFRQLKVSFNRIWDVPVADPNQSYFTMAKGMAIQWVTSFGMVLALGFLLLTSLAMTGVTAALLGVLEGVPVVGGYVGYITGYIITLLINTLIFALMFKYLPDTRVKWRDVLLGAFVTAVIWELAKRGLSYYIGTSSYTSAYGLIGSVLVLMAWIYFSSQVVFLGAEFTQVYAQRHGSRKQAGTVPSQFQETYPPPLPELPASLVSNSAKVGAATGAGLVVGALGGVVAAAAMLVVGTRRALTFKGRK